MTRIKTLNQLLELERRKKAFEDLLQDATSHYLIDINITASVNTNSYISKYSQDPILVDVELLKVYLKAEIEKLENKIEPLIEELKNV